MFIKTNHLNNDFLEIEVFDLSENKISEIILYLYNLFNGSNALFRATGLWENISEIVNNLKDCKVDVYEGDKNKFYMKRFPEIHVDICDIKQLNAIVDSFVNIIYEGRYLYFFDENKKVSLQKILKDNVYYDHDLFGCIQKEITCLVQSIREYDGVALTIIINKEYCEEVKKLFKLKML